MDISAIKVRGVGWLGGPGPGGGGLIVNEKKLNFFHFFGISFQKVYIVHTPIFYQFRSFN